MDTKRLYVDFHVLQTGCKKNEKKTVLYTAPKAYNSFLYNLRKLYPKKEGGTA